MKIPAKGFTHGGKFHADDVFSTALLQILRPDIQITRGFTVPDDFDGIGQRVLLAGVVVQVKGLDKVLVQQACLMLAHKLGAQHPPQQAERRVGHAVGAALARLGVVVEHTAADVVDDAVEVIRHNEAPRHLNVRAQDL